MFGIEPASGRLLSISGGCFSSRPWQVHHPSGRPLMDVKRLLLLIPLAVLAYLIVVQWNQDYGQVSSPEPEAPSFTASSPNGETQETDPDGRSEEHTSELQSRPHLVCRLLLEIK